MPILVKNGTERWHKATEAAFANEEDLQQLLYASPELMEREDDGAIVFTRESSLPGSGSTDLIGVTSGGEIVLVETKLAKNPEIRRKVIGQILEYAAFLWGMPFDEFDALFIAREGKSLADLVTEKTPDLSRLQFEEAVAENLKNGRFNLFIVVDDMNKELERIISYISNFAGGVKLEAVSVKVHRKDDTSVLVAQRFGQLDRPGNGGRSTGRVTLEEALARIDDEHTRNMLSAVIGEWTAMGHLVAAGRSGFSCKAEIGPKSHPVFWVLPEGGLWCIEPLFSSYAHRGAPAEAITAYRQALSKIQRFPGNRCLTGDRPPAKLREISDATLREFLNATTTLLNAWRSSVEQA